MISTPEPSSKTVRSHLPLRVKCTQIITRQFHCHAVSFAECSHNRVAFKISIIVALNSSTRSRRFIHIALYVQRPSTWSAISGPESRSSSSTFVTWVHNWSQGLVLKFSSRRYSLKIILLYVGFCIQSFPILGYISLSSRLIWNPGSLTRQIVRMLEMHVNEHGLSLSWRFHTCTDGQDLKSSVECVKLQMGKKNPTKNAPLIGMWSCLEHIIWSYWIRVIHP